MGSRTISRTGRVTGRARPRSAVPFRTPRCRHLMASAPARPRDFPASPSQLSGASSLSNKFLRLQSALDRVLAIALATLIFGTAVAFGGAVWWMPVFVAGLTGVLVVGWLARALMSGG